MRRRLGLLAVVAGCVLAGAVRAQEPAPAATPTAPAPSETLADIDARFDVESEASQRDIQGRRLDAYIAYLAANPEAEDKEPCQRQIMNLCAALERDAECISWCERYLAGGTDRGIRLDALRLKAICHGRAEGGEDAALSAWEALYDEFHSAQEQQILQFLFQHVVSAHMEIAARARKSDRCLALLSRAETDFASVEGIPQAIEQYRQHLARLAGQYERGLQGIRFTATDGSEVDLESLRGKVVLVDFWATWCGPCMREMPRVVRLYQQKHAEGFEIVGISLDQQRASLDQVTQRMRMVWPQYFDGKGWQNDIAVANGIQSIPATYLVDKTGAVRYVGLTGEELEGAVERLLRQ